MKDIAVVLVVVGIMMMAVTGLNHSSERPVENAGVLEMNVQTAPQSLWTPYVGGFLLTIGLVLIFGGRNALKKN